LIAVVLDRLRLQAVEDELRLLFESDGLSADAQTRGRQLMAAQALLKAQLARSPTTDDR
jgi:hypothetical protein